MVTKVGNLRVYCNGKIFVGPDWKSLLVSFLLISLPSLLYLSLIAAEMGPDVFWLGFLLVLFNLTMLALTGLSNPGVIPRRPAPSGPSARIVPSTRTKDYKINGYTISTKYCTTCQIYRVPRCSHCAMSDNCVEKFDHYCPWVGTCIGRRNYRYFLLFVFSGTALCLLVCATSLSRLVEISGDNDDEFDTALKREPIAIVLVIYTFGAVWFVGGLSAFHIYLVLTNQTTYEHIRRRFGQHGNPYDKGVFMNMFEACCQPNPPYDWESDSCQVQNTQETSRTMELPAGVVINPTVIAMQQAAKEQAEKARVSSNRGSDVGSCSQSGNVIRDNPSIMDEYQDSLYSSSSSVEARQPGMTMGHRLPQTFFPESARRGLVTEGHQESEITQEEAQDERGEESSASLDRGSSRQSLGETGSRRLSSTGRDSSRRGTSMEQRHSLHPPVTRGDSANASVARYSEAEMAVIHSAGKRPINPFAYPDDSVHTDSGHLDVITTLSSLTSNTTSEVSSHRTERSERHGRRQGKRQKNRKRVMSMQEIMSTQQTIPDLRLGRRPSVQQQERRHTASGEIKTKARFLSSEGLARFRAFRASGENVFNNLRALMKKQSRESQDPNEDKTELDVTSPVFINIEEASPENIEASVETKPAQERPAPEERSQDEGQGLRGWVPQLGPLSQQKYTELKEAPPSPFEEPSKEEEPSQRTVSNSSVSCLNNSQQESPTDSVQSQASHRMNDREEKRVL